MDLIGRARDTTIRNALVNPRMARVAPFAHAPPRHNAPHHPHASTNPLSLYLGVELSP